MQLAHLSVIETLRRLSKHYEQAELQLARLSVIETLIVSGTLEEVILQLAHLSVIETILLIKHSPFNIIAACTPFGD